MNLQNKIDAVLDECGGCALDDDGDRARLAAVLRRTFGTNDDRCSPHCPGFFLEDDPFPHQFLPQSMRGFHIVHACSDCKLFGDDFEAARYVFNSYVTAGSKAAALSLGIFDLDNPESFLVFGNHQLTGPRASGKAPDVDVPSLFKSYADGRAALSPPVADYAHYLLHQCDEHTVDDVIRTQSRLDREREPDDAVMPFLKLLADANNALTPIGHVLEQASEACDTLVDVWDDFDQEALNDAHEAFAKLCALLRFR